MTLWILTIGGHYIPSKLEGSLLAAEARDLSLVAEARSSSLVAEPEDLLLEAAASPFLQFFKVKLEEFIEGCQLNHSHYYISTFIFHHHQYIVKTL